VFSKSRIRRVVMGVARTDYVIYGVNVPFNTVSEDEDQYDEWLDEYEDNGYEQEIKRGELGLTMVSDGMNGDYAIIGFVMAKALQYDGLPMTDCYREFKENEKTFIKDAIKIKFGIDSQELKVWAFSHFH
jgi:hypothetical protein